MKTTIKKTTNTLLVSLIVLLSVSFAQAQPQGQKGRQQGPPPLPNDQQIEKMVTDLSKELSLSEEQEKKISDLYFAHFREVGDMRKKQKEARDANREDMRNYRDGFEKEVKSNLTEEQQKEYDTFVREQRSKRAGKGNPKK